LADSAIVEEPTGIQHLRDSSPHLLETGRNSVILRGKKKNIFKKCNIKDEAPN
jgi:hypothetical protein